MQLVFFIRREELLIQYIAHCSVHTGRPFKGICFCSEINSEEHSLKNHSVLKSMRIYALSYMASYLNSLMLQAINICIVCVC